MWCSLFQTLCPTPRLPRLKAEHWDWLWEHGRWQSFAFAHRKVEHLSPRTWCHIAVGRYSKRRHYVIQSHFEGQPCLTIELEGIIYLWQGCDERVNVGLSCRFDDFVHRHLPVVISVLDVLGQRTVKQHRLLGHDAHFGTEPRHWQGVYASAINFLNKKEGLLRLHRWNGISLWLFTATYQFTSSEVIKPLQKLNAGWFATARRPD